MKMTMDDIQKELETMAKDPEAGADKFRALKMLASMTTSASVIPEPYEEQEVLARLVRVMRPAGSGLCQIAYQKAFAKQGGSITATLPPKAKDHDLSDEELGRVPRTLRQFYRRFPELKGPGYPKGYPAGRGVELKLAWLREQTIKILTDRKNEERRRLHEELKESPPVMDDGTTGHQQVGASG